MLKHFRLISKEYFKAAFNYSTNQAHKCENVTERGKFNSKTGKLRPGDITSCYESSDNLANIMWERFPICGLHILSPKALANYYAAGNTSPRFISRSGKHTANQDDSIGHSPIP